MTIHLYFANSLFTILSNFFMKINPKNWAIIIPARLGSTRLARKPLQNLAGKPLIIRVCDNLKPLMDLGIDIHVATDSREIYDVCKKHSYSSFLTSSLHNSGTERCCEVSTLIKKDFIINVQGDEPFLETKDILAIIEKEEILQQNKIITLAHSSKDIEDYYNPNSV